jgi:urate oxidase / 2-oxo-4-hydroxy-4-carboxy-5-ureidoimidazoline decarboxylase
VTGKPSQISYGKAAVSVYRTSGAGELFAAEVRLDVFGEAFLPSYTEGDNSLVVATDSMKNFVHVAAVAYEGESLEGFLALLGSEFLGEYDHVESVRLVGREIPFARTDGSLFRRLDGDYAVAEVARAREGIVDHRSGRERLHLVKLTGSAFRGFVRDRYTTLPDADDRPLGIHLNIYWRHGDFERRIESERVREHVAETFADFVSESIQHLVHEMGVRLLDRFPEISEVSFEGENRLWDLAQTSDDGDVKVYTDPRPPYGVIALTLAR